MCKGHLPRPEFFAPEEKKRKAKIGKCAQLYPNQHHTGVWLPSIKHIKSTFIVAAAKKMDYENLYSPRTVDNKVKRKAEHHLTTTET